MKKRQTERRESAESERSAKEGKVTSKVDPLGGEGEKTADEKDSESFQVMTKFSFSHIVKFYPFVSLIKENPIADTKKISGDKGIKDGLDG